MIRLAKLGLAAGLAAAFAACARPATPFVAENQPSVLQARAKKAEEAKAKKEAARPQAPAAAAAVPTSGNVTVIPVGLFFERQQAGTVLTYDVRPAFFHGLGNIPGSKSWPESAYDGQLAAREQEILAAVAAGRIVVIYCSDPACPDARKVADRLAQRGHSTAVLEGGWEQWKAAELPST
jgi:rhodanese-related sulfurtransferase